VVPEAAGSNPVTHPLFDSLLNRFQSVSIASNPCKCRGFLMRLHSEVAALNKRLQSAIELNQTHRMSAVSVNIGVNKTKKPNMEPIVEPETFIHPPVPLARDTHT
jgi:hypothetical protein